MITTEALATVREGLQPSFTFGSGNYRGAGGEVEVGQISDRQKVVRLDRR